MGLEKASKKLATFSSPRRESSICKGCGRKKASKEIQEVHNAEARIRHEGGGGQIMRWRGKLGTLLKHSGAIFDLGHRKPLKVLNKGHVLQVKEGFVPQPPQLEVVILGEVDTENF